MPACGRVCRRANRIIAIIIFVKNRKKERKTAFSTRFIERKRKTESMGEGKTAIVFSVGESYLPSRTPRDRNNILQ